MRTTVDIDDDLLAAARALAKARNASLGEVLSDLLRRGLRSQAQARIRAKGESGFPVFEVGPDAPVITPELVKQLEDRS
jgi:hypothetical protein